MKLYVHIFKRLDLKSFGIFKNTLSIFTPQKDFRFFFLKNIGTDTCLTCETLHYPWIPSYSIVRKCGQKSNVNTTI